MDNIPLFCREREAEFEQLFQRKTQFCSQICSFAPGTDAATDAKTRQLKDLLKLLECCSGSGSIPDDQRNALYSMIEANLIRPIAATDVRLSHQEDLPPFIDPRWPHVNLVYQILNRFVCVTPNFARHLTFASLLLPIGESPDPNERAAIAVFYDRLVRCSKTAARAFLTNLFCDHIRNRIHGTDDGPFLVSPMLSVLFFVLNETSVVTNQPQLFVDVIMPLLRHPLLAVFQVKMTALINFFLDVAGGLALLLARYLLSRWPWGVASKQVIFIDYIFAAIEKLAPKSVESLAPAMRRVCGHLGETPSEAVANALCGIWLRSSGEKLNVMHGRILIPILAGPIADLSSNHWSPMVRQNARIALSVFQRRDHNAIHHALHSNDDENPPPQLMTWIAIIQAGHQVDESIVIGKYFAKVSSVYVPKLPPDVVQTKLGRKSTSDRGPMMQSTLPAARPKLEARSSCMNMSTG
jgi:hypothetical protein